MKTKIWIGNNKKKRKLILSLFDVNLYGGKKEFKNCTSIYFYKSKVAEKKHFDVRCRHNETDKVFFKLNENKEVKIK